MKKPLPANAKITALVCSGRMRPKDRKDKSRLKAGAASCKAAMTPTSMPTMPHTTVASRNFLEIASS